jgi:hypothetical protein
MFKDYPATHLKSNIKNLSLHKYYICLKQEFEFYQVKNESPPK